MPDLPDIPAINRPPTGSLLVFLAVILFVVVWFIVSTYRAGKEPMMLDRKRLTLIVSAGLVFWLLFGAVLPMSGLLNLKVLPPPGLIFALVCFAVGAAFAFSNSGKRLTTLPVYWLVGFHAFRLPLELVLHRWYATGTIPIQMTYEGFNFDIATGILALIVGAWAKFGSAPKFVIMAFNVIGLTLLLAVVLIAVTSVPTPFRQFTNEPALLLPFYFPYSYIVSVAVTGALIAHLVLFRKLALPDSSNNS